MMQMEENKVMEELGRQMEEMGYEIRMEEVDGLHMLRVVLDELGAEGEGSVLMELCFLPLGADGLPDDLRIFQIFTTIERNLSKDKLKEILLKLNGWNLECILGGFHVYEEEMQLYHKYVGVIRGNEAEQMLSTIQPAVNWIASTIMDSYDELIKLCR